MNGNRRVYLDHAAAGRGNYLSAHRAGEIVYDLRCRIARCIDAESRQCVSLHTSGTAALNAAIQGLLRPGDHVVTTAAEHNSVLRPLEFLRQHAAIEVTIVPCSETGAVDAQSVLAEVRPTTRMVAIGHASNVTGAIQPVADVGMALRDSDTLVLCDAAQTFGYLPLSVASLGVDLLAFPGHKGGGGPLGTAALYVESSLHDQIVPQIQGGTGFDSESLEMPQVYPAKLEAGNLNMPGFAGWLAAITESADDRWEATRRGMQALSQQLRDGLAPIPHLRVIAAEPSVAVTSVVLADLAPVDASTILDSDYGIETRAGIHCAALIHEHLGTQGEGTLRISAGLTTTAADIDAVISAMGEIVAEIAM